MTADQIATGKLAFQMTLDKRAGRLKVRQELANVRRSKAHPPHLVYGPLVIARDPETGQQITLSERRREYPWHGPADIVQRNLEARRRQKPLSWGMLAALPAVLKVIKRKIAASLSPTEVDHV